MANIIGLVAVDRNRAIGRKGALPWHYAADMKFFRQQTTGHACVMGYRTWLSLKKPLKDRLNIVLSRSSEIAAQDGGILLRDKVSVLSLKPYLSCDLFYHRRRAGLSRLRGRDRQMDCYGSSARGGGRGYLYAGELSGRIPRVWLAGVGREFGGEVLRASAITVVPERVTG